MNQGPTASEERPDAPLKSARAAARQPDAARRSQALRLAGKQGRCGQLLDALQTLHQLGPLRNWTGAERVEVAWIIRELGAPRLALWHILKAYREAPQSLAVRNAYASEMLTDRGPLETLEFLQANPRPTASDRTIERLHWMWLFAIAYVTLRDFSAASRCIEQMEAVGKRADIVWFVRANLLERQDRYDAALQAIDRAIELKAGRRPIQYKSHLLTLRGRDDEAYALLQAADGRMQVGGFAWQMALIDYERRDYAACQRMLQRFESLTPLRERSFGDLFLLFRSELARRLGDDQEAIRYASQSRSARGREIAAMLADPQRLSRTDKILPVPFIRQHEMTCGPATLAAVSVYWGQPAEHLEVAEEICYAGTTTHAERKWAEANGFTTAEFTMTEAATEALIEREIPFTLVTRGAGYAHLQAVIGYDGRTATALIRDPYHRTRGAVGMAELLQDQAPHGPRAMVMVPRDEADRLAGLELPDAPLHDLLHRFDGALIEHRRDDAVEALRKLTAAAADHRITLQARRQLALYDGDEVEMLAAVEQLLEQYPDEASFQLTQVSLLGALGRQHHRLARLRELVARPQPHPLLMLQLGEALSQDGRQRAEAERLIRMAIRRGPTMARSYLELGDLWFTCGRRREALRAYRFAAALEETDELLATRYFDAAVLTGHGTEALRWLSSRFKRLGGKSRQPAVTLAAALVRQRRHSEALTVLDEALQRRPHDAELKLFVAQTLADISSEHWPRAEELLAQARNLASERQWRSTASQLCMLQGDWQAAREHLLQLLPLSPMAVPLHESITELTAQIEGPDAVIEHWRDAAAKFPHHLPLQERYAIALRDRPLEDVGPVLEKIISHNPENAWAHRELAQHLLSAGQLDAAAEEIDRAETLAADHDFTVLLRATLAHRRGDPQQAKQVLRELIARDVNHDAAVQRLLALCQNADQVREELQWLIAQMQAATITGEVLLIYRDQAEALLPKEEVLQTLRDALAARGDLWPAHQAVIRQLTHMQRIDEATAAAAEATDRFPLEPAAWFERFQVAVAAADHQAQRAALERVRLLRPGNPLALRALAELDATLGDYASSRQLLEELVAKQPLDPVNRGYLGHCLLELEQFDAALAHFEQAARLAPEYEFAWEMMSRTASQLGKTDHCEHVARSLTQSHPHETAAWIHLAYRLAERGDYADAFACLDQAQRQDPYRESIHIARSRFHINEGDYEAALAALSPPVYQEAPPTLLLQRTQLMWDLGQQDAAYELVTQTAYNDPALIAAWQRLQQWAMIRGDRDRAAEAIEHQVAADPYHPDVLDTAAGALADLQMSDRAIELFRRAIEIAPSYTGSRCRLFDLLVEREQWEQAAAVVSDLGRMDDHPAVMARRLQVAEHHQDRPAQDQAIEAILQSSPINGWALDQAAEVMTRQQRRDELIQRIEQAIQSAIAPAEQAAANLDGAGTAGEESSTGIAAPGTDHSETLGPLGRKWAELRLSASKPSRVTLEQVESQIRTWATHPCAQAKEAGRAALTMLVEYLRTQASVYRFYQFLNRNRQWLRADNGCWGTIAYAFAASPTRFSKSQMKDWIADYQDRGLEQAWVYTNVQEILRLTGQRAAAVAAVQHALALPPDVMRSQLALWATHDCLVAGDPRRALHHFMQAARYEDLIGTDRLMHVWVESVLMLVQSPDRCATFADVRRRLAAMDLKMSYFNEQPVYRPVYIATLRLIAEWVGTARARWWARVKRIRLFLGY